MSAIKRWKCTVCGKIFEGDTPPVPCPVCRAGEEAFVLWEEPAATTRWKCTVCGQIFEGVVPPVPCPVCGAGEDAFEKIEEEIPVFSQNTNDMFVLVGGGVAALEAAKAIRKRNSTATITIVSAENHYPYNRPTLSDVVAEGISFANIILEQPGFYMENKIALLPGVEAQAIDVDKKMVQLSNEKSLPYTKLLLATGANSFNPIKQQSNAIPVRVLRSYEDAENLVNLAGGKRVVLVGGGILGLEAALALRERNCVVTVVEFAPRILSLQADEAVSAMIKDKLEELGIRVLTGISVQEAGPGGVILSDGAEMAADVVLASMGVRSEVALAQALGLELSHGIVVDEFMHTSHADIWAAGDCAEFAGRVQAIAGAASGMGAVAGASMAGDETVPYKPFVPATMLEFADLAVFSVGNIGNTAETVLYQNTQTGVYRRLFFNQKTLAGALFVGKNPGAKAVTAVTQGVPFAKAMELLSD
ncbi:FAD-dependent oxidoreductase [Ruminococcaceae bacterium OttesenSCG-928-A16]|nr:FAD-dependent oxidoreductase [Ruminococcaceae bacterium OttesenSCG-928-A16]